MRERLGDGSDGADAHLFGQAAGDGVGDEAGQRAKAELARASGIHEDCGGCAVGGLRGVAGGDGALRVKDGLELRERCGGSVGAGAFVGGEDSFPGHAACRSLRPGAAVVDGHGDELFGEAAGGLRGESFLVARERKRVLIVARDCVMAGDALGGEAHGEQRGRIVRGEPGIGAGLVAAHGNQAHGFGAAGDDDARARRSGCADRRCAMASSPEAQRRLTVAPGISTGRPARSAAMRAMLKPCSPSGWAQPRITSSISALSRAGTLSKAPLNGGCGEIVGARGGERAFGGAAHGRANGGDENGFGHEWLLWSSRSVIRGQSKRSTRWLIVRWRDGQRSS